MHPVNPIDIIDFWFMEVDPRMHWRKDFAFDQLIAKRFMKIYKKAAAGELAGWRTAPEGRLAEVIVLDQFPRNMFRNTPTAFATDPLALALAQEAVAGGFDQSLPPNQRRFLYMPFMHSESLEVHASARGLFETLAHQATLDSELRHYAVLEQFGRYPHRNAILGRASSPAETTFLQGRRSGF